MPAIPEAELAQAPAPARLAALQAFAQRDGWSPLSAPLRAAAFRAYRQDRPSAEAWLQVARWAALWGQSEAEFVPHWIEAVNAACVGHANQPREYSSRPRPLGSALSPPLQAWILSQPAFSAEALDLISPVDYLPTVLGILDDLHRRDAARFRAYPSLALACAVVLDVPPPPDWPHAQVSAAALPRRWPEPAEAFAWWVREDQAGRTYHRLARLGAAELRFVVDAAAPGDERAWAVRSVHEPLSRLAEVYQRIRYRTDRAAASGAMWTGRSYALADILAAGGICADQAYFAAEVGKARGVPTLFFSGPGSDGRHAWFGYLDGGGQWQLDAGRQGSQRFVTGRARDPQTWGWISDHELRFLTERFRSLPAWRQSRLHAAFAAEYLAARLPAEAAAAARRAVSFDRRNTAGWDTLAAAARAEGREARVVEAVLREATLALASYPDLEAAYANRVASSLRSRGQISEAEAEERRIAQKHRNERGDLSVGQAREMLLRTMGSQPVEEQLRTFQRLLDQYGRPGGVAFFDGVVTGFVEHLLQLGRKAEASRVLERVRQVLHPEPSTPFGRELARWEQSVREKGSVPTEGGG